MFRMLMIALICAAPAAAQIDQDADNFGVFFDLEGTETSTLAAPGIVDAYLLLINPSPPAYSATNWLAGCWTFQQIGPDLWPVGPDLVLSFDPSSPGITVPEICGPWLPAYGGPLAGAEGFPIVLGTFAVLLPDMMPYGFYDYSGWGEYSAGMGPSYLMGPSTRFISSMPPFLWLSATINSDYVPVAETAASWGALKALYR